MKDTTQLLYPNVRQYLADCFWAIRPNTLDMMCDLMLLRANGGVLSQEEVQARIGVARGRSSAQVSGAIAVLPLYGVIDQKVSMMMDISGGTSVDEFMAAFRTAMADNSVSAIVFDVDSPGGNVSGIMEAANEIYSMRGKKRIVAVANPTIASAAYWIASAADEIVCMPSGMVGSIGVIAVHADYSAQNEQNGYKPTYITYGQYKGEGNRDTPLSDDAKAYKQTQVDAMGDMFTRFVAKARNVGIDSVRSDFGQGRMLLAKDALAAKMIDSIGTLDQTIARLSKPQPKNAAQYASEETVPLEATADAEETTDFSLTEATTQTLVGLDATLQSWHDLVGRTPSLTNAKTETLSKLQQGIRDASAKADAIVIRAGTQHPKPEASAPVATAPDATEATSDSPSEPVTTDAQKAVAEFEILRARSLGVRV